MKRILSTCLLALSFGAFAQVENVGIGTTNPDNSAILDLSSSTKGFLLPRMTKDQRINITKPAAGLQVFQTDGNSGLYVFNGENWTASANSVAAASDPWVFGGNSVGATDFIGTTNSQPLRFKVTNLNAGFIDNLGTSGRVFLGREAGNTATGNFVSGLGYRSLMVNTGNHNTAIGYSSLSANLSGSNNVSVGSLALLSNTTGSFNLGVGSLALRDNTTGIHNAALGSSSLLVNTSGSRNLALGSSSLFANTTGSDNVGIGFNALAFNVTGINNTSIGTLAGKFATGSNNVFIGYGSGENESGNSKLYISNTNTTTPLIYGDFAAKFVSIGDVDPSKRASANTSGGYNLLVKGGILTEKVKVALASSADWADYVFEDKYRLTPLSEVEEFIKRNKHLPNVPSAEKMVDNGLEIAQMNKIMMEKIEELTLYIIQLNKEIEKLKK